MTFPRTPGHARGSDTSQQAAQEITPKAAVVRERVFNDIAKSSCTVHECADRLGLEISTVQPRFSELRAAGRIKDSGLRRINRRSQKRATVWEKT